MVFFLWLKSRRKLLILFPLMILVSLSLSFMPDKYFERVETIRTYEEDRSAMGRINSWWFAFRLAQDYPITGGGFQAFTEEAELTLGDARATTLAPYSIAVVDMDNLKAINDKHGHMAGNEAIVELGQRMRAALDKAVEICRYGGDEFVALIHASAEETRDDLSLLLNGLTTLKWDKPFKVRASIGIAEFQQHGRTTDELIEAADRAMYLAKGGGGHRIRLADVEVAEAEVLDAVVQVQARRVVPEAIDAFNERLVALRRRAMLGLMRVANEDE